MTPAQIKLARHALGLNAGCLISRRNVFVAASDTADFYEWRAMVEAGLAEFRSVFNSSGAEVFKLTRAGAEAALRPGDRLNPEDWPAQENPQ